MRECVYFIIVADSFVRSREQNVMSLCVDVQMEWQRRRSEHQVAETTYEQRAHRETIDLPCI